MSYLQEALLKKEKELTKIIAETEEALKDAPKGNLRIDNSGNKKHYYLKEKRGDEKKSDDKSVSVATSKGKKTYANGNYISVKDEQLAHKIAQRDYDKKLYDKSLAELKNIQRLLNQYTPDNLQKVFESMNEYRKDIVTPRILSDEMVIEEWSKMDYDGKPFKEDALEIYAERGERVRSKTEKIIADKLYMLGIPYKYECPLTLKGFGKIYPDFTILCVKKRQEYIWEHFGMMDNQEYVTKALNKIDMYEKNGYFPGHNLIISHETSLTPINTKIIDELIKVYIL